MSEVKRQFHEHSLKDGHAPVRARRVHVVKSGLSPRTVLREIYRRPKQVLADRGLSSAAGRTGLS